MKNKKRAIPPLPKGAGDKEIIRIQEPGVSELVGDHSDLDRILEEAVFQDNTAQLNMRIPPAMKAALSRLVRERTTDATTLARMWLAERLKRELKAG